MTHRKEKPARTAPPLQQASAVLLLLLLLLGLLTACSSDGANDPASKKSKPASICKDGVWPTEAAGQPKSLKAKPDKGYYVWYDAFGWHLRVVDPQGSKFQGVIESSGSISAIPCRQVRPARPKCWEAASPSRSTARRLRSASTWQSEAALRPQCDSS